MSVKAIKPPEFITNGMDKMPPSCWMGYKEGDFQVLSLRQLKTVLPRYRLIFFDFLKGEVRSTEIDDQERILVYPPEAIDRL